MSGVTCECCGKTFEVTEQWPVNDVCSAECGQVLARQRTEGRNARTGNGEAGQ